MGALTTHTSGDFAKLTFPDTTLVEGGVLHQKARCMIAGEPGVGKSYVALQIALESALGQPWLGIWNTRKKLNVLYVQVEVSEPLLQTRLIRLSKGSGFPENLRLFTDEEFLLCESEKDLGDTINTADVDLVLLDPLYMMHVGDENSVHTIRPTQQVVDRLRREYGTSFVIMHHVNKGEYGKPSLNMLRGSSGWVGWVDTVFLVTKAEKGIKLHMLKARNREDGLPKNAYYLKWQDTGRFFKYQEESSEDGLSLVIAAIDDIGEKGEAKKADVVKWVSAHGVTRSTAYAMIMKLVEVGLIMDEEGILKVGENV